MRLRGRGLCRRRDVVLLVLVVSLVGLVLLVSYVYGL